MKLTFRIWTLIIFIVLALLMISPTFEKGVVIKSVDKNSTAFQQGLRQGMIIKEINMERINSYEDYTRLISEPKTENLTKYQIKTDQGDFIFLQEGMLDMTAGPIPKTKIKTGLDLSGGARAIVRAVDITLTNDQLNDLVAVSNERFNAFGISDVNVRAVSDLEGNKFMLVEVAGVSPSDLQELVGKQGKFEAKIGNQTVFVGGDRDVSDVCRNDATCAAVTSCSPSQDGSNFCNFAFTIYLSEEAAERHAEITKNISLDETGQYLSEKLTLYIDDNEVDSLFISSSLRGQKTTQISIQGSGTGITGEEALKDAKESMNKLQTILITGSLPYKLEIVKLDTISSSLGREFSRSMILLGFIVFIIVSIAIFIKYRKVKITLAVILTMFSEAIITLGIAAFIRWNLDAPAIAGLIAGLGTGINDQIVILDETMSKASESSSVKSRVKRALFIILGAFVTIVAAMLPLFWAGAGLFKGFAFTTILGVTVGILITRPAFADIVKRILEKEQ